MKNILNFDIIGWLCLFCAGIGLIFPFSAIAQLNLIFISLGLLYLVYFVWREFILQRDPAGLNEARKSWILCAKIVEIEERKFEHKKNPDRYILLHTDGITFNTKSNKNKTSTIIPWSEVIQFRSTKILGQELHTIYCLNSKYAFDQSYEGHLELIELIKKML